MRGGSTLDVSVVIPARNARDTIAACVASVLACDPPPAEVIVVDDFSSDDTATVARAAGARVLRMPRHSGPGAARNRGAREATQPLLAFTDADCEVRTTWLARMVSEFDPGTLGVTGGYGGPAATPDSTRRRMEAMHAHSEFTQRLAPARVTAPISSNLLTSASGFRAAGGFPEYRVRRPFRRESAPGWGCEDLELGHAMVQAIGGEFVWMSRSDVLHRYRTGRTAWWRQQARYCRGIVTACTRDPHLLKSMNRYGRTDGTRSAAAAALVSVVVPTALLRRRPGLALGAMSALVASVAPRWSYVLGHAPSRGVSGAADGLIDAVGLAFSWAWGLASGVTTALCTPTLWWRGGRSDPRGQRCAA